MPQKKLNFEKDIKKIEFKIHLKMKFRHDYNVDYDYGGFPHRIGVFLNKLSKAKNVHEMPVCNRRINLITQYCAVYAKRNYETLT